MWPWAFTALESPSALAESKKTILHWAHQVGRLIQLQYGGEGSFHPSLNSHPRKYIQESAIHLLALVTTVSTPFKMWFHKGSACSEWAGGTCWSISSRGELHQQSIVQGGKDVFKCNSNTKSRKEKKTFMVCTRRGLSQDSAPDIGHSHNSPSVPSESCCTEHTALS